jgi:hypothetical protein
VWDAEKQRPNANEASMLVTRVLHLPTPKCDPKGKSVFAATEKLRDATLQLQFFWLASRGKHEWSELLLRGDANGSSAASGGGGGGGAVVDIGRMVSGGDGSAAGAADGGGDAPDDWEVDDGAESNDAFTDTVTVELTGGVVGSTVVHALGPMLPQLTIEQRASRPWLRHVDRDARRAVLLRACGASEDDVAGLARSVDEWSAAGRDVFATHYPPDPPETAVVALWAMVRADPGMTDRELLALATMIVCACEENVLSAVPDNSVRRGGFSKPCWRPGCTGLPDPTAVIDVSCCTPEYRRASFITEQWSALFIAVGRLNWALGLCPADGVAVVAGGVAPPFLDGGAGPLYGDGLVLRTLLQKGCACSDEVHAGLARRLVALARSDRPAVDVLDDVADRLGRMGVDEVHEEVDQDAAVGGDAA